MGGFFELTATNGLGGHSVVAAQTLDDLGRQFDAELGALRSHCIERVIRLGTILNEAKALAGHGQWLTWLEARDLPERTARRWMEAARNPEAARLEYETKSAILADIEPEQDDFPHAQSVSLPANDEEGEIFPPKGLSPLVHSSGYYEWYTPKHILEAAKAALGGIDLDPASSSAANENVQAVNFLTIDDNALDVDRRWNGRIWLNPPYNAGVVDQFVGKLVSEYEHPSGGITSAILLTHACPDTAWFQLAASRASCICFPFGRINFLRDGIEMPGNSTRASTFFYFGSDRERFKRAFAGIGYFVRFET